MRLSTRSVGRERPRIIHGHTYLFTVAHEDADAFLKGVLQRRIAQSEDVYGYQHGKCRAERDDDMLRIPVRSVEVYSEKSCWTSPYQSPTHAEARGCVPIDECNALRGTSQSIAVAFGLWTPLGGAGPFGVELVRACLDLGFGESEASVSSMDSLRMLCCCLRLDLADMPRTGDGEENRILGDEGVRERRGWS